MPLPVVPLSVKWVKSATVIVNVPLAAVFPVAVPPDQISPCTRAAIQRELIGIDHGNHKGAVGPCVPAHPRDDYSIASFYIGCVAKRNSGLVTYW